MKTLNPRLIKTSVIYPGEKMTLLAVMAAHVDKEDFAIDSGCYQPELDLRVGYAIPQRRIYLEIYTLWLYI